MARRSPRGGGRRRHRRERRRRVRQSRSDRAAPGARVQLDEARLSRARRRGWWRGPRGKIEAGRKTRALLPFTNTSRVPTEGPGAARPTSDGSREPRAVGDVKPLRDRSDVRVLPGLLPGRRKAELGEALRPGPAQPVQPAGVPGAASREALVLGEIVVGHLGHLSQALAFCSVSRSQS